MSRTPKTKHAYCPHCDSNREPFFSRSEPMGFYCYDCGRDVDDKTTVSTPLYKDQEQQLNDVRRERDRLAEACKLLMGVIGDPNASAEDWWATEDEINAAWNSGSEALAAVKGGSDE